MSVELHVHDVQVLDPQGVRHRPGGEESATRDRQDHVGMEARVHHHLGQFPGGVPERLPGEYLTRVAHGRHPASPGRGPDGPGSSDPSPATQLDLYVRI